MILGHIYEKFIEDSDPISDMGIGMEAQIKKFVKEQGYDYKLDMALWICSLYAKLDFVNFLLDKGADIHAHNDYALQIASVHGHKEVVELLLQHGADVHTDNDYPLQMASANGHKEVVELLLQHGADVHVANDYVLRYACIYGHKEIVELLLKYGADVHAWDDMPLEWASLKGHKDIVKILQDHMAKENKGVVKESLLEKFIEDSDPISDMGIGMEAQMKKFLKEVSPASVNQPEKWLYICARYNKINFIEYLLDTYGNKYDNLDHILRMACEEGNTPIVKLMLNAGADVHAIDNYALRWASYHGYADIVKLLLDAGANVHAKEDEAILLAKLNNNYNVVEILKDHIAKENKGTVKESLLEKFTEDSDPISDMGIGPIHISDKFPELFGNADINKYIFTIYIATDFLDLCFWQPHIEKIMVQSMLGNPYRFFKSVVNIISDLGFSKVLYNPRFYVENKYISKDNVVKVPSHIRYDYHPSAFKQIKNTNFRRYETEGVLSFYKYGQALADYIYERQFREAFKVNLKDLRNDIKESLLEKFIEDSDPISDMSIGGYSFETLRPGAIIKAKKLGVALTWNHTGRFTSFVYGYKLFPRYDLLVTKVIHYSDKYYNIQFNLYRTTSDQVSDVYKDRETYIRTGEFPYVISHNNMIVSKRMFDSRFQIIERGI